MIVPSVTILSTSIKLKLKKIKNLLGKEESGPYAIIADCSSYAFNAEALMVRKVCEETWEVLQILAGLNMYQGSPNGENTAASLLQFIDRLELPRENWLAAIMDGCKVNTKAINDLVRLVEAILVARFRCLSHFFSGTGERMESKEINKILKYLRGMNTSPKCVNLFRELYEEEYLAHKTVRWYCDFEFVAQIDKIGLESLVENFVQVANENDWAEKSTTKLIEYLEKNPLKKVLILVGLRTISHVGKPLCESCYIMESDSNLVFRADSILCRLDKFFGTEKDAEEDFTLPESVISSPIKRALEITEEVKKPLLDKIDELKCLLSEKDAIVAEKSNSVTNLSQEKEGLEAEIANNVESNTRRSNGRRGRGSGRATATINYQQMANGTRPTSTRDDGNPQLNTLIGRLNEAVTECQQARVERDDVMKNLGKAEKELQKFNEKNIVTKDGFMEYALNLVKPAIKYYIKNMYLDTNGDFVEHRKGYRAARVFDPEFIKNMDTVTLEQYAKDLKHFGIEKLNGFIDGMINEVHKLKNEEVGNWEFEFSKISRDIYDDRDLWRTDESARAKCIWKWWASRQQRYKAFGNAVKIVALIQTSSAAVERAFSQLKEITLSIGMNALQDNYELRMMRRVNGESV